MIRELGPGEGLLLLHSPREKGLQGGPLGREQHPALALMLSHQLLPLAPEHLRHLLRRVARGDRRASCATAECRRPPPHPPSRAQLGVGLQGPGERVGRTGGRRSVLGACLPRVFPPAAGGRARWVGEGTWSRLPFGKEDGPGLRRSLKNAGPGGAEGLRAPVFLAQKGRGPWPVFTVHILVYRKQTGKKRGRVLRGTLVVPLAAARRFPLVQTAQEALPPSLGGQKLQHWKRSLRGSSSRQVGRGGNV